MMKKVKLTNIKMEELNKNQTGNETPSNTDSNCLKVVADLAENKEILLRENRKLLTEIAETEIKIDHLRLEMSRLKSIVQNNVIESQNSPNLSFKSRSPLRMGSFFRTPIRSISNTLLKNSKSSFIISNSNNVIDLEDESEIDFSSDTEESDGTFTTKSSTSQNSIAQIDFFSADENPSLAGAQGQTENLKSIIYRLLLKSFRCLYCENKKINKKSWIKKLKKKNKVDVHYLDVPEINVKRTVTINNSNNSTTSILVVSTPNTSNKKRNIYKNTNTTKLNKGVDNLFTKLVHKHTSVNFRFDLDEPENDRSKDRNKNKTTEIDDLMTVLNYAEDIKINSEIMINLVNKTKKNQL